MSSPLKQCRCTQFADLDPSDEPPKDRLELHHYAKHGPIQPPQSQVRRASDSKGRTFQAQWYSKFAWLEYSLKKMAAFCFFCRLFGGKTYVPAAHGRTQFDPTFSETGYSNWSKALDKSKGFTKHADSAAHKTAVESYRRFMRDKPVDAQVDHHHEAVLTARQRAAQQNRAAVGRLFAIVLLLTSLGLTFRGHNETATSHNRGVFLEMVYFLAMSGDEVLKRHLESCPRNAQYTSNRIQNDMISIVGQSIKKLIVDMVKDATFFTIMMDETRDTSHQDQVVIVARFVRRMTDGKVKIEERLLRLIPAVLKTGEALENLLLCALEQIGLCVMNIVAQCYDGGSNFAGVFKGVQARIQQKNPLATFIHCFPHSLNRAAVNSMNHKDLPSAREFFSHLELLVTFIKSGHRFKFFLDAQRDILSKGGQPEPELEEMGEDDPDPASEEDEDDEDEGDAAAEGAEAAADAAGPSSHHPYRHSRPRPVAPGKGISDTRWDARAYTLDRFSNPVVLEAALKTVDHVLVTTGEATVIATALGLKRIICSPRFLLLLCSFKPVLIAIKTVSKYLQTVNIDLGAAIDKINTLKAEVRALRSDEAWAAARAEAEVLAQHLGMDLDAELESRRTRTRKRARGADPRPETETHFSAEDKVRVSDFYPAMDKLIRELNDRFPEILKDFKYLKPKHYKDKECEATISRLASRYKRFLNEQNAVAEWRLFRHTEGLQDLESMLDVASAIPDDYEDLFTLFRIYLTMPITTASLERRFSKMAFIKDKLSSTMGQTRLEAMLLGASETDLTMQLNCEDLTAQFAAARSRRLLLS